MYYAHITPQTCLIAIIILCILWWGARNFDTVKTIWLVPFKIAPFYKNLKNEYCAIYPTYISYMDFSPLDIDPRNRDDIFIFIADSSFHIVSKFDRNLHIEIPFGSILYQNNTIDAYSKYEYSYKISLMVSIKGIPINLYFETLNYNHILDKIYGSRISGEELYNFIQKNFNYSNF